MSNDGFETFLVAFFMGMLVMVFLILLPMAAWKFKPSNQLRLRTSSEIGGPGVAKTAWNGDMENGEAIGPIPLSPRQLRETLRQIIETEFDSGLKNSSLAKQLDRLEEKIVSSLAFVHVEGGGSEAGSLGNLRTAAQASEVLTKSAAETRTPNSSDGSRKSSLVEDLRGMAAPESQISVPPLENPAPPPCDPAPVMNLPAVPLDVCKVPSESACSSDSEEEYRSTLAGRSNAEFWEVGAKTSLAAVQQVLAKRDAQTTELHKQLKQARQDLWSQVSEARYFKSRYESLICDRSKVPAAQVEAMERVMSESAQLSRQLADSRDQAKKWQCTAQNLARQQRHWFMQYESLGQEGAQVLRRHPCGEVFQAVPPATEHIEEDDNDLDYRGNGWNVGTSHCNPYKVDSWPFQPNVLAQRTSKDAFLPPCEDGSDSESSDDEVFDCEFCADDVPMQRSPEDDADCIV